MSVQLTTNQRALPGAACQHPHRGRTLTWIVFIVMAAVTIVAGLLSASTSQYWSRAQILTDFMNGPIRLLLPIAASLVAASPLAEELSQRGMANLRSRQDIHTKLVRTFGAGLLRTFAVFAATALLAGTIALTVAPSLWKDSIDPEGYGLKTSAQVLTMDAATTPLSSLQEYGWAPVIVAAAMWLGSSAAVFGLVALVSVILIRRTVIALIVPTALYIGVSFIFEFLEQPSFAFLVSAVYPAGLQDYPLWQAMLPTATLGALALLAAAVIIARSPTNERMS